MSINMPDWMDTVSSNCTNCTDVSALTTNQTLSLYVAWGLVFFLVLLVCMCLPSFISRPTRKTTTQRQVPCQGDNPTNIVRYSRSPLNLLEPPTTTTTSTNRSPSTITPVAQASFEENIRNRMISNTKRLASLCRGEYKECNHIKYKAISIIMWRRI